MIFIAGRFSPLGGLAFRQYQPCIASLFQQTLQPYFGQQMPEVMRVVRSYPFGITETTQPYNAIVVTLRAPEGMKLIALPTRMKLPTGQLDHRSWHDAPGAVPQLGTTSIHWFLKGTHEQGHFIPYSNAATSPPTRWCCARPASSRPCSPSPSRASSALRRSTTCRCAASRRGQTSATSATP